MERFVGKVAVVVGASSGIGAGIAENLVDEGLIVIGLARRVELVEEIGEKLKEKPGKLHPIKCDVAIEEELISTLESIEEKFGPIHVLINNAGINNVVSLTTGFTPKMREVINVNFMATVIATTEVIKHMQKNQIDGHIINVSSVCADTPMGMTNVYGCSKAAVNYFSEVVRKDLVAISSKIKISIVSPGAVSTDMLNKGGFDYNFPKLDASEIVNSIAFILSRSPLVQVQSITVKPVGEPF